MEENISDLLRQFTLNLKSEATKPYKGSENTKILTRLIPELLKNKLGLASSYEIQGSVGAGSWAEVPWFAILDKSITTSTTKGYYVVALFEKNLTAIQLVLGIGWTQFEEEYGKYALEKIREVCDYYSKLLNNPGFNEGPIDLGATSTRAIGYEAGSIFSKRYLVKNISDEVLMRDIHSLLTSYSELKTLVGDTIDLFREKVLTESHSKDIPLSLRALIEIANKQPPEIRAVLKKEISRNKQFAYHIKNRVGFICEMCERKPFIQRNGKFYAEADHIIPLGGETRGLDSPDNMRCLCAQCHAVVTHGTDEEIRKLGSNYLLI